MNVVIGNRNEEKGNEVVKIIKSNGGDAKFLKTDVSIENDVKNLTEFTLKEYGEFNYAFNNSGLLGDVEPISEQDPKDSGYIIDVNIKGVVYCIIIKLKKCLNMHHKIIHAVLSIIAQSYHIQPILDYGLQFYKTCSYRLNQRCCY